MFPFLKKQFFIISWRAGLRDFRNSMKANTHVAQQKNPKKDFSFVFRTTRRRNLFFRKINFNGFLCNDWERSKSSLFFSLFADVTENKAKHTLGECTFGAFKKLIFGKLYFFLPQVKKNAVSTEKFTPTRRWSPESFPCRQVFSGRRLRCREMLFLVEHLKLFTTNIFWF